MESEKDHGQKSRYNAKNHSPIGASAALNFHAFYPEKNGEERKYSGKNAKNRYMPYRYMP